MGDLGPLYFAGFNDGYTAGLKDAAEIARTKQKMFGSNEYAVGQPWSSHGERFACGVVIKAIEEKISPSRTDQDKG